MTFIAPWLLLLSVPIAWLLWQYHHPSKVVNALRVLLSIVVVMGLTEPQITAPTTQQDILIVVDRSDSMPSSTETYATEWIQTLEGQLNPFDRFGVISVATNTQTDQRLGSDPFKGFSIIEHTTQSNLNQSLLKAIQLLKQSPNGKIVVITDGAKTDGEFHSVQAEAMTHGIPIHTIFKGNSSKSDIKITKVQSPSKVKDGDQTNISVNIESSTEQTANIILYKDDVPIAQGAKLLKAGNTTVHFSDIANGGGVHTYKVVAKVSEDDTPHNNTAEFGVLTDGKRRVLVLSVQPSVITKVLKQSGVVVQEANPATINLTTAKLSQFEAVILHNIPSTAFTETEIKQLAMAVEHSGLGLWMVGGAQSFGVGGFLHTPIENVLPVNLEIRDDIRKLGMALGIALDRSGSMSVSMGPNVTKMDLANQGSAAALTLLNSMDSIFVAAVDTNSHTVVPLQVVNDPSALSTKVLGIQSEGGGIFVGTALQAQYEALKDAEQRNRHVVLFADAADSQEDIKCSDIIQQMREADITISVIALGQPSDTDAGFLANVARLGGGSIYFSTNPKELPKLFAMDTMIASQSGYLEEPTPINPLLGLTPLGGSSLHDFPIIEAYNIAYPRAQTQLGLQTATDNSSPLLVYGQYGLGQSVAYLGDIGGQNGQQILKWAGFNSFIGTIVSSISSGSTASHTYAGSIRNGTSHELIVETKESARAIQIITPNGAIVGVDVENTEDHLYSAKYTTTDVGIYIPQLVTDKGVVPLPPISTITSAEYTQNTTNDKHALSMLSQRTKGLFNPTPSQVAVQERLQSQVQSFEQLWVWLSLLLLLAEIAERKIRWSGWFTEKMGRPKNLLPSTYTERQSKAATASPPQQNRTPSPKRSNNKEEKHHRSSSPAVEVPNAKPSNSIKEALKQAKKERDINR